jgi:hypothetical protein
MTNKFECKKGCKDCFHGKLHSHKYTCEDTVGKCPRCSVSSKKGEGNDKIKIYWKA